MISLHAHKQNARHWLLPLMALFLVACGLVTMSSFGIGGNESLLVRQLMFLLIGVSIMATLSFFDISFLKRSALILAMYSIGIGLLLALFVVGSTVNGATSWFQLGAFSFQPADLVKLILILILAKYLSRRHVEMARAKHLLITGLYFFIPFGLILLQPDFGSAAILLIVWFGMVLISGISRKHLLAFLLLSVVAGGLLWGFVFKPYQKDRILTFLHPTSDITGTGYNSYQSIVTVGSGRILGKGIGYGTQSRLQFLPENETDFIFASFAEEWGFAGSIVVLMLFLAILFKIIYIARRASSSFESLVAIGIALYFGAHILVNIGMNIGLLPVTGVTLPFMSYGGSHLITECIALGLVLSISRYRSRVSHPDEIHREFYGYRS